MQLIFKTLLGVVDIYVNTVKIIHYCAGRYCVVISYAIIHLYLQQMYIKVNEVWKIANNALRK